jgi:SAM-dependent methyltransferase
LATKDYGSIEWCAEEYRRANGDPWGLTWRPSQSLRYQRVLALIREIPNPISTAADIGCATGDFTNLLRAQLPHLELLLGVDFVGSAVERARQRFPQIQFAQESIFSIGAHYRSQFDLITCLEVLYYIDKHEQRAALKSLKEALRKGGYAVFSSFISSPPHFQPGEFIELLGSEFEIVTSDILHLKIVSALERIGTKCEKFISRVSRGRWNGCSARRLGQLPPAGVRALEKWSFVLKGSASHTLILAQANKKDAPASVDNGKLSSDTAP